MDAYAVPHEPAVWDLVNLSSEVGGRWFDQRLRILTRLGRVCTDCGAGFKGRPFDAMRFDASRCRKCRMRAKKLRDRFLP